MQTISSFFTLADFHNVGALPDQGLHAATSNPFNSRQRRAACLALALAAEVEQVLQGAEVDATPLRVLHVRAKHRVRLAAASLAICKDTHVVPCIDTPISQCVHARCRAEVHVTDCRWPLITAGCKCVLCRQRPTYMKASIAVTLCV